MGPRERDRAPQVHNRYIEYYPECAVDLLRAHRASGSTVALLGMCNTKRSIGAWQRSNPELGACLTDYAGIPPLTMGSQRGNQHLPVHAGFGQAKWAYFLGALRLKRPIHLCVPICSTHCPFRRHIPGDVFTKSTPIFFQRPWNWPPRLSCCQASLRL